MSYNTNPPYPTHEPPPPYTPSVHQQGSVGGKPVYTTGPPPPPTGFYVNPGTSSQQYAPHQIIYTQPQRTTHYVVPVDPYGTGICPACRTGHLVERTTVLGWCCCIFLFPIGIICCMAMTEKRCTRCNMSYN